MEKIYEHQLFGKLKYDERMEWYVGEITFQDEPVDICVPAEDENSLQKSLKQLENIYKDLSAIDVSARAFATSELLNEKNSNWLDEDEAELSAADFENRLHLESIIIGNGAATEFFYDDDGMFFDHAVLLTRHEDGLWTDAEIAD